MTTPILDFLRGYNEREMLRFHMPGHKGKSFIGPENWDITEVSGADALYEARGIIAQSEDNLTSLYGSARSFYSTEGSSQCIRAMLHLLLSNRKEGAAPLVLAARNAHKAFVYSAALLDFDICWLYPEESSSLCSCPISPMQLERDLGELHEKPCAVYITSPDYLGNVADIAGLARVCHRHGTYLAVDNAHGAYLHFLHDSQHPLDLGADICCDSAHKTLPVLTGGAYLHIGRSLPESFVVKAKNALALFGSTSPSYLTLASLDACNAYLSDNYRERLESFIKSLDGMKSRLIQHGWQLGQSDPLRLCLRCFEGMSGQKLCGILREKGIEAEYADNDFAVFMFTPENDNAEIGALEEALLCIDPGRTEDVNIALPRLEQKLSVREAVMAETEIISIDRAENRICALPMVSCPPAIPIVISGESIDSRALELLKYYGIEEIEVIKAPEL